MESIVSASAARAVFITGDNAWLLDSATDRDEKIGVGTARRILSDYDDRIESSGLTLRQTRDLLKKEVSRSEALLLTLLSMDPSTSNAVRVDAISLAEKCLQDVRNRDYVEKILFSTPLPSNSLVDLEPRYFSEAETLNSILASLAESQAILEEIESSKKHFFQSQRLSRVDQRRVNGVLSHHGVGRLLCNKMPGEDFIKQLDSTKFNTLRDLESIAGTRSFLINLFSEYSDSNVRPERIIPPAGERSSGAPGPKTVKKIAAGNNYEMYEVVKTEIAKAKDMVGSAKLGEARIVVDRLVERQMSRGDSEFAAMSLCNLSEEARKFSQFSLQLEWAKKAADISPSDPRTHAHVGEACMALWRMDEAYAAFERCRKFGDMVFGSAGIARVHRALYRYEEALEVLESAMSAGSGDVHFRNLRAALLRDLGRFDEALQEYMDLKDQFPADPSSMSGYAALLADVGSISESEVAYREAMSLSVNQSVPAGGLGFLLVKQGRFEEGLELLDLSMSLSPPSDMVALEQKLKALRIQGRYDEALALAYEHSHCDRYGPGWVVSLVRILIDAKSFEAAASEIEKAIERFSAQATLRRCKALLLSRSGRLAESLSELNAIKAFAPRWVNVLLDRARVLKRMGEYDLAQAQLEAVLEIRPDDKKAQDALEIVVALRRKRDGQFKARIERPSTLSEWQHWYTVGLLNLANDEFRAAKTFFMDGVRMCPFQTMLPQFRTGLAASRIKLNQTHTAIRDIRKAKDDDLELIQKTIVLGERNRVDLVKQILPSISKTQPENAEIIRLVELRYLGTGDEHEARPSQDDIMQCQIQTLLRSA